MLLDEALLPKLLFPDVQIACLRFEVALLVKVSYWTKDVMPADTIKRLIICTRPDRTRHIFCFLIPADAHDFGESSVAAAGPCLPEQLPCHTLP